LKDPVSLVPFLRAIRVELMLENSFTGDAVGANGARDKIPGVVGDQGNTLFFHGAVPVWIDEDGAEVSDRVSLSVGSRNPRFARVVIE
jgi:hypothetical protein